MKWYKNSKISSTTEALTLTFKVPQSGFGYYKESSNSIKMIMHKCAYKKIDVYKAINNAIIISQ